MYPQEYRSFGVARHGGLLRAVRSVVVTLFVVLILVGCSKGQGLVDPPTSNPYSADFARALDEADSEFVGGVLADGEISRVEYLEAMDAFANCLKDAGLHPGLSDQPDGTIQVSLSGDESGRRDIEDVCRNRWLGEIDTLYAAVSTNPDKLEWYDQLAACLVHQGVVPAGFSGDDMRAFDESVGQVSEKSDGSKEIVVGGSAGPLTLPGGTDYYDPKVVECLVNPAKVMTGGN